MATNNKFYVALANFMPSNNVILDKLKVDVY